MGGLDILRKMEQKGSENGKVSGSVTIRDCNEEGAGSQLKAPEPPRGPAAMHGSEPAKRMGDCADGEVRALHILRKHKDCRKPSSAREKVITCTKAQAKQHLQNLRELLIQQGTDFEALMENFGELAKTDSDCGTAKKRGDLGCFG